MFHEFACRCKKVQTKGQVTLFMGMSYGVNVLAGLLLNLESLSIYLELSATRGMHCSLLTTLMVLRSGYFSPTLKVIFWFSNRTMKCTCVLLLTHHADVTYCILARGSFLEYPQFCTALVSSKSYCQDDCEGQSNSLRPSCTVDDSAAADAFPAQPADELRARQLHMQFALTWLHQEGNDIIRLLLLTLQSKLENASCKICISLPLSQMHALHVSFMRSSSSMVSLQSS